ncbi:MAG: hypothetical protein Q8L88_09480 [Bacteroidota bacterium]|nr:hypothetical protein [Bacteroidota bacterium]
MEKYLRIFFALIIVGFTAYAQESDQKSFFFGSAIEFGIPYRELSNLGFAIQGEYLMNNSFGVIGEYASLNYNGPDDETPTIKLDFTISAPAIYICWHTASQETFNFFIGAGLGYTTIKGKIGTTSFVFTPRGKNGLFLPQAKMGIRYWVIDDLAIRANFGFYRLFSFGVDYSL